MLLTANAVGSDMWTHERCSGDLKANALENISISKDRYGDSI